MFLIFGPNSCVLATIFIIKLLCLANLDSCKTGAVHTIQFKIGIQHSLTATNILTKFHRNLKLVECNKPLAREGYIGFKPLDQTHTVNEKHANKPYVEV